MAKSSEWYVGADPLYVNDEEALSATLQDVITILTRLGGGVVIAAHRKEVTPGNWMTVGFHVRYESFVPGERYKEPEPVEEDEPAEQVAA